MNTQIKMKIAQILLLCALNVIIGVPVNAAESKRVIIIDTMPVPVVLEHRRWFVTYLNKLGYIEGESLDLKVIQANGDVKLAETLLIKTINQNKPDLVVTNATLASKAAVKVLKDTKVPILFFTVSDPVGAGLIKEIGIPTGTNVTGRVHMIDRTLIVNMVMRLIGPAVKQRPIRMGYIHSTYPSALGDIRELKAIAEKNPDIEFISYQLPYLKVSEGLPEMLEDTRKGIEALKDRVDFWWEPSGPLAEVEAYTNLLLTNSKTQIVRGQNCKASNRGLFYTYLQARREQAKKLP
jgi:putative tryptophan/tyrosine transport system substrate-binding protein